MWEKFCRLEDHAPRFRSCGPEDWTPLANPPLLESMAFDPVLTDCLLIAAELSGALLQDCEVVRCRFPGRAGAFQRFPDRSETRMHLPGLFHVSLECELRVLVHAPIPGRLQKIGRRGAEIDLPAELDNVVEPFLLVGGADD